MLPERSAERERSRTAGIVTALKELTDGMNTLFRQHLELARLEAKEDARIIGGHVAIIAFFGVIALLGYALLNTAAILFAGWGFGIHGMAIAAFALALVNLGIGTRAMLATMKRLETDGIGLDGTAQELEKDIEWMKEIREK